MKASWRIDHLSATPGKLIALEGSMGVGKSTFASKLAEARSAATGRACEVFPEPVDKAPFRTLLGLYYGDPARWGFAFQMYVLKERLRQHTLAVELVSHGTDVVQDRSIFADCCFAHLVYADGNMTKEEWDIYRETFGAFKRFLRYPDIMIYLRAEPEVVHERVKRRARSEESAVPLDYLRRLHDEHEQLIQVMSRFTRVVVFDWSTFDTPTDAVLQKVNAVLDEEVSFLRYLACL